MPGYTPTKPYGSGPRPPERRIAPAARRRGKTCGEPRFLELRKQGEVDFVVKHLDRSLSASDVSYTDALPAREEKALLAFAHLRGSQVRECILLTNDTEKTEGTVRYVPLWKWLLGAG